MDTLLMLLTIAAGSIIFVIINKIFSIAYFGFKGIFITWFCCVLAAYYLGGILLQFKWIIIVAGIVLFLVYLGKKGGQSTTEDKEQISSN
ncbi:MAG: hypothetical protein ACOX1Y_08000 [Zhaonellaceae bacterium]|jgi:membrane protein implicated in regulation of membrane protease activity